MNGSIHLVDLKGIVKTHCAYCCLPIIAHFDCDTKMWRIDKECECKTTEAEVFGFSIKIYNNTDLLLAKTDWIKKEIQTKAHCISCNSQQVFTWLSGNEHECNNCGFRKILYTK